MSFKAKNLTYEAAQPAFLRRLRGEITGDGSGRHEQPIPRNKRLQKDDEEDEPTYVVEGTNQSLSKAEYEALVADEDANNDDAAFDGEKTEAKPVDAKAKDLGAQASKDKITEVGKVNRKRKAIKVIGFGDKGDGDEAMTNPDKLATKKPKKKAKTVKLSFGDQEEEG